MASLEYRVLQAYPVTGFPDESCLLLRVVFADPFLMPEEIRDRMS